MRSFIMLACLVASPAIAGSGSRSVAPGDRKAEMAGGDSSSPTLTAAEIQKYVAPYYPAIRACYLGATARHRLATGALDLQLIIHRDGTVFQLTVDAPGVTGSARHALEACLRAETARWHFPVRYGFTHAIVPYLFVHTYAPGTGPRPSCWNPNGCPTATRR